MARTRRNDDLMRLAAVSAAVSLVVVLVFFGGTLTGNATSTNTITVNAGITATTTCTFNGTDIIKTDLALETDDQAPDTGQSITVVNDGSTIVNMTAVMNETAQTLLSTSTGTSNIELSISAGSGTGTNINLTTSAQDMVTLLLPDDADDQANITTLFHVGGGASNVGTPNTALITFVCTSNA